MSIYSFVWYLIGGFIAWDILKMIATFIVKKYFQKVWCWFNGPDEEVTIKITVDQKEAMLSLKELEDAAERISKKVNITET